MDDYLVLGSVSDCPIEVKKGLLGCLILSKEFGVEFFSSRYNYITGPWGSSYCPYYRTKNLVFLFEGPIYLISKALRINYLLS